MTDHNTCLRFRHSQTVSVDVIDVISKRFLHYNIRSVHRKYSVARKACIIVLTRAFRSGFPVNR